MQELITQSELQEFIQVRDAWMEKPFSERMGVWRAPFCDLHDRLNERFEAGATVEPGILRMRRDRTGVIVIDEKAERSPRKFRASQIDTPTPAQLQAWFDLPSEPRQIDGSPSGS